MLFRWDSYQYFRIYFLMNQSYNVLSIGHFNTLLKVFFKYFILYLKRNYDYNLLTKQFSKALIRHCSLYYHSCKKTFIINVIIIIIIMQNNFAENDIMFKFKFKKIIRFFMFINIKIFHIFVFLFIHYNTNKHLNM